MLQDTDRFLLVSKRFLQQHRAVRGTSSSPIDIIKSKLKFNFNNPTRDEQRAAMNKQWAEFSNDHPDLANPNPGADHSTLVGEFITLNMSPRACSKAQHFMFAYLRDYIPKITTLTKAYSLLLPKWMETKRACEVGIQVGMIFPENYRLQHMGNQSYSKQGGSAYDYNSQKRPRTEYSGDNQSQPQQEGLCTVCGIKGHLPKQCQYFGVHTNKFANQELDVEYANSSAWGAVLAQYPNILAITKYPRVPRMSHLSTHDRQTKHSSQASGGGGRGRGTDSSRGRGNSSPRG